MDETSWSQTWSTKSTATTNRKLLKRRQKCLLLQADQRLKQNQEDLPLLEGFNTVDPSGQEILYFRALQGHSGRNPIEPSPQDNVFIPNNFIEYFYHIGCAVSLHSITNSGLITGDNILAGKDRRYSSQTWIPRRKIGENQTWKSTSSELSNWAAS